MTAITFVRGLDSFASGGEGLGQPSGTGKVGNLILSIQDDHQADGRCLDWIVSPTKGTDEPLGSLG